MSVPVRILLRSGSESEWAAAPDVILDRGEPGYDTTNRVLKIGTGGDPWHLLPTQATEDFVQGAISEAIIGLPIDPDPGSGSGGGWSEEPPGVPSTLSGAVLAALSPEGTMRRAIALSTYPVTKSADGSAPKSPISGYEYRWKTAKGKRNTVPSTIGPGGRAYAPLNELWDRRGKGGFGWIGGDGAASSRRSDGKDAWFYGDSMVGGLLPNGRPASDVHYGMVNNAIVVTNPDSPAEFTTYLGKKNLLHTGVATTSGSSALKFAVGADAVITFSAEWRGTVSTTSLKVTTAGASASTTSHTSGTPTTTTENVVAVTPGTYTLKGLLKTAATSRSCRLFLQCYNDADVSTGQALPFGWVSDTVDGVEYNEVVTVPAGSTKAVIRYQFNHPANTPAGEGHFATNLGLFEGDQRHQSWSAPAPRDYDGIVRPEGMTGFRIDNGFVLNDYWIWLGAGWSANGKTYSTVMVLKWATTGSPGDYGDIGKTWLCQWDEATMAYEGSVLLDSGNQLAWTDHAYTEGGYTYIIGHKATVSGAGFMMRVPAATPMTSAATFWNGTSWVSTAGSSTVVIPADSSSMHKIGSTYHAYRIDPFSRYIMESTSTSLTSGWSKKTVPLYEIPEVGSDTTFTYLPRLHPQFDSPEGRVFGYSQNNGKGSITDGTPRFAIGPRGTQVAPSFAGVEWSGQGYANSTSMIVSPVASDSYFYAEVRAVDASGNASANSSGVQQWSALAPALYVPPVVEALAQPATPHVDAQFSDAEIRTTSLTASNAEYSSDVSIEVHVSRQPDFAPAPSTLVDTVPSTGGKTFVRTKPDSTRYVRTVAVAPDGARSAPSPIAPMVSSRALSIGVGNALGLANPGDDNFHYIRFASASEWGFFPYDHIKMFSSDALVFGLFGADQMTIVKEQGINALVPLNMRDNPIRLSGPTDPVSIEFVRASEWGFFPHDHIYSSAPGGHRWSVAGVDVMKVTANQFQLERALGLLNVTTAERPSGATLETGSIVYDSTIQKIIIWNGANWLESGGGGGTTATWSTLTGKPTTFPSAWTDITGKPSTYAPSTHTHAWVDVTGKPTTFPPDAHTHVVAWGDITNQPGTYPPSVHSHAWADITGKPEIPDMTGVVRTINGAAPDPAGNIDISVTGGGGTAVTWADVTGKPTTYPADPQTWASITSKPTQFAPSAHTHAWTEVTGKPTTFTPATHTHAWADVTGRPTTFTPAAHTHTAVNISDSTAVGRAVLTAATEASARTALGIAGSEADVDFAGIFESRLQ